MSTELCRVRAKPRPENVMKSVLRPPTILVVSNWTPDKETSNENVTFERVVCVSHSLVVVVMDQLDVSSALARCTDRKKSIS